MAATVTVTGVAGPAITVTAQVFTNVLKYAIDCVNNVLEITGSDDFITKIGITSATTITATKSGSTYALTVS